MLNADNFKTITELRLYTLEVINKVVLEKKPIYIISRSKPQAIIISIDEYGKLLELKRENQELRNLVNRNKDAKN